MKTLKEMAGKLQTSVEILISINLLNNMQKTEIEMLKIWANPTERESQDILEHAWLKTEKKTLVWAGHILERGQ